MNNASSFMLKSGDGLHVYTFPHAPQKFEYQPQPRIAKLLTIGGVVLQLTGASVQIDFEGQITTSKEQNKFQRTAGVGLFLKFAKWAIEAQQSGEPVQLIWSDRNLDITGSITGFNYEQDLETVCYTYSIQMQVNDIAPMTANSDWNTYFDKLKNEIGFSDPGGGWHGGTSSNTGTWQNIKAITGLDIQTISSTTSGSKSSGTAPTLGGLTPSQAKALAYKLIPKYGLSQSQFSDLVQLWKDESSWRWQAENASGAYGIAQRLGHPLGTPWAFNISEQEYKASARAQIIWGLQYIKARYGTIAGALAHENEYHWY